eukprot:3911680-Lingulodinium_polyedra.AAC.1
MTVTGLPLHGALPQPAIHILLISGAPEAREGHACQQNARDTCHTRQSHGFTGHLSKVRV